MPNVGFYFSRGWYVVQICVCHLQRKSAEVKAQRGQLTKVEQLSSALEDRLILDNRYTFTVVVDRILLFDRLINRRFTTFSLLE